MRYQLNSDLPERIRRQLPYHAQDIYRQAFNYAAANYRGPRREEAAHRSAWIAVRRDYVKVGDMWIPRVDVCIAR